MAGKSKNVMATHPDYGLSVHFQRRLIRRGECFSSAYMFAEILALVAPDRMAAWCECATQQQEGLAACLDWVQAPDVETKVAFPRLRAGDLADLSFDDSLVIGLLQQRTDTFVEAMASLRMVGTTGLHLRSRGDVLKATYLVVDAWRETSLAARWLLRSHGTASQQERLVVARARHPEPDSRRPFDQETSVAASMLGRLAGLMRGNAPKPGVLVVDDDADSREAFELFVTAHFPHLRVTTAPSGASAMQALMDPGLTVVLSDLKMPDQDGIRFLQQAAQRHPGLRCFLMTGYTGPAILAQVEAAGIEGIFQKPLEMARLTDLLRQIERGSSALTPA